MKNLFLKIWESVARPTNCKLSLSLLNFVSSGISFCLRAVADTHCRKNIRKIEMSMNTLFTDDKD